MEIYNSFSVFTDVQACTCFETYNKSGVCSKTAYTVLTDKLQHVVCSSYFYSGCYKQMNMIAHI